MPLLGIVGPFGGTGEDFSMTIAAVPWESPLGVWSERLSRQIPLEV